MEETEETSPSPAHVRYENLPQVVIAGRPNAGKSTLFNRLLHRRVAITDPTPGVTRDPVETECLLPGTDNRVLLIDTGGFKIDREGLDDLVVEKSLESLRRADLIIFLVDCTKVTPEDEEFAAHLRRYAPKILLVVNKADSPERDSQAYGHLRWGFEPLIFISAEHGRNIDLLVESVVERLDFSGVREVDIERADIRLAIMGKPNTGKSTLLNRFLGQERSIVSEVAGTTRDVVEGRFTWKGRGITVLDTAGIRRKSKVTENVEYYSVTRALAVVERSDVVILLIDAQEGLTEQDKKITSFAAERGRGIIFALNKWDLMPEMGNNFEAARDKLRFFFGQMAYAPVLQLSAKEGDGVDKLLNTVITLYAQLTRSIPTSAINRAVEAWIEATPPPAHTKHRFRFRYACQIGVDPQKFVFFVTRPEHVPDSYVSYLRNKLRDEFDLDRIPLLIALRDSRAAGRDGAAARIMASRSQSAKPRGARDAEAGSHAESGPRRPTQAGHRPSKAADADSPRSSPKKATSTGRRTGSSDVPAAPRTPKTRGDRKSPRHAQPESRVAKIRRAAATKRSSSADRGSPSRAGKKTGKRGS